MPAEPGQRHHVLASLTGTLHRVGEGNESIDCIPDDDFVATRISWSSLKSRSSLHGSMHLLQTQRFLNSAWQSLVLRLRGDLHLSPLTAQSKYTTALCMPWHVTGLVRRSNMRPHKVVTRGASV